MILGTKRVQIGKFINRECLLIEAGGELLNELEDEGCWDRIGNVEDGGEEGEPMMVWK